MELKCPTCGDTHIRWTDKSWDASTKDFWGEVITVGFLCRGKFKFYKDGTVEQISKCRKNQNAV